MAHNRSALLHTHTNAHVSDRGQKEIFRSTQNPTACQKAHDALSHTTPIEHTPHKHTDRPSCHTCAYNDQNWLRTRNRCVGARLLIAHTFFTFFFARFPYGTTLTVRLTHYRCAKTFSPSAHRHTDLVCRFFRTTFSPSAADDRVWMMGGFFSLSSPSPFFSPLSFSFVSLFTPDSTLLSTRVSRSG